MFLRFQRGKSPIKRPCALPSDNPSPCYSFPQDLGSVFPALQHRAIVARDLTEPAGVPGWALPAAQAPPRLSPNRGCCWCFPPNR